MSALPLDTVRTRAEFPAFAEASLGGLGINSGHRMLRLSFTQSYAAGDETARLVAALDVEF